jgi:natural product precursor
MKLDEQLSFFKLNEKKLNSVTGGAEGGVECGCACAYSSSGGSSIDDNCDANHDLGGLWSPGAPIKCVNIAEL